MAAHVTRSKRSSEFVVDGDPNGPGVDAHPTERRRWMLVPLHCECSPRILFSRGDGSTIAFLSYLGSWTEELVFRVVFNNKC